MTFIVAEEVVRFGLRAGAVLFRNVQVNRSGPVQRAEMQTEVAAICSRFSDSRAIRTDPLVSRFQSILRTVGVSPKNDRPSVERLLTYALKRGALPDINNLVDAYNLVSIRSLTSLGAHDLDRIRLPVSLRILDGTESFTPLGSDHPVPSRVGEFGYVDASNRLLCRLDILQADFSKVTETTQNALLIVEWTDAHSPQNIRPTCEDVIHLVTRFCGGAGELVSFPE